MRLCTKPNLRQLPHYRPRIVRWTSSQRYRTASANRRPNNAKVRRALTIILVVAIITVPWMEAVEVCLTIRMARTVATRQVATAAIIRVVASVVEAVESEVALFNRASPGHKFRTSNRNGQSRVPVPVRQWHGVGFLFFNYTFLLLIYLYYIFHLYFPCAQCVCVCFRPVVCLMWM